MSLYFTAPDVNPINFKVYVETLVIVTKKRRRKYIINIL